MKYFMYAMAQHARDEDLQLHDKHPSQSAAASAGTEISMPGGVKGTKR